MKRIKRFITRKTLIYKTEVEYGDYTMNHVLGCSHGCLYPCYAFLQKKRFGEVKSYEDWCEPALVINTLDLLEEELPKYKHRIQMLHLCFTTDPFMYQYPEIQKLSLEAIAKINSYGVKCSVLTKGLLPIELASYSKENEYGIPSIATHTYRVPTDILEKRLEDGHLPLTVYMISYLHKIGIYTVIDLLNFPIIELKLMPDMDTDRYERLKASLTKINSYFSEDGTPVFRALREC